jgi:hypothetical protein
VERVAWIIAGIVKDISRNDLLEFLGLLADDSGGVKWAWETGLLKTNFQFHGEDAHEAERKALAKFANIMEEAGLPSDALHVRCLVSPPNPHVGWEWPAELRNPTT